MFAIIAIRRKLPTKAMTFFIILCISVFTLFGFNLYKITKSTHAGKSEMNQLHKSFRLHVFNVEKFYEYRLIWPTSKLGGILFNREEIPYPNPNENKTYVVLVWKYWEWLKRRHVYNFNKEGLLKTMQSYVPGEKEDNYLTNCSVNNCIFSGDEGLMKTADAVLVHLQRGIIPQVKNRNPKQRWIFLNDESPTNAFSLAKNKPSLDSFYNVFNWSMTYRSDADVPVPYGRTLPLDGPIMDSLNLKDIASLVPNWKKKSRDTPAALLMSNCAAKARNDFLNELRQYITVDVYGRCSDVEENKNSCPGHFKADCEIVDKYMFYLVLENTSCFQYLTEKIFYHAYAKGAIPVIWGPSIDDVESLLPPYSYIFVDSNAKVQTIAKTILTIMDSDDLILSMHIWRNNFKVVNEHGYFGSKSYHLCRLCEALNYNDKEEKIYRKKDINEFLNPEKLCSAK